MRGLTLTRIMLHHHNIFREPRPERKEMVGTREEQGKIGRRHCSTLAGIMLKGGYEIEMRHSNAHLSIYRMGDVPAFMKKGDTSAFVLGDGMGDVPAFVIKGDVPLEMCVSLTCVIGDMQ
jgi:hypothetical protein